MTSSTVIKISFLQEPSTHLQSVLIIPLIEGRAGGLPDNNDRNIINAYGYTKYLEQFWLPTIKRKYSATHKFQFHYFDDDDAESSNNDIYLKVTSYDSDSSNKNKNEQEEKEETNEKDKEEFWMKLLVKELKKVIVEDLGNMNAIELWNSIPKESDKDGRSQKDLLEMEQQIGVKVVFGIPTTITTTNEQLSQHVLLVGSKIKLQKKSFVIRNLLKHYHWRLTGKE